MDKKLVKINNYAMIVTNGLLIKITSYQENKNFVNGVYFGYCGRKVGKIITVPIHDLILIKKPSHII